jgi:nitroimidazol reductase NimA-like FMN-containing flavoprotein (pyridoxamine 5'-phosphate oxidase superfamily)
MSAFPKTDKTEITRLPKRGDYSQETVFSILDEALVCTLAFADNGEPFQIPTGFCRIGNQLYVHGSVGSHYMRLLAKGDKPVCISATLLDGLVLARSAFHHSMNYRSVVMFGTPRLVADKTELYQVLEVFTEKMCPGRWADVRKPTDNEWKATMVLAFTIEEASAKVRTGPPKDDEEDYSLDVWAGVLPLSLDKHALIPDPALKAGVTIPTYLQPK